MKKIFALAVLFFLCCAIPVHGAEAEYVNGNTMYLFGEVEYYSNPEDEDRLYRYHTVEGTDEPAADEHIISLMGQGSDLYLLAYDQGNSRLMRYDMEDEEMELMKSFSSLVSCFALHGERIYYIEENRIQAIHTGDRSVETVLTPESAEFLYFSDSDTLTYYEKRQGEYLIRRYHLGERAHLPAENGEEGITPFAVDYIPRLAAPAMTDPYYTNLNIFHQAGYGMTTNGGNCTCYAYGRAYENLATKPNLCTRNAENWYQYNVDNGFYPYSAAASEPALGAVAVWRKGVVGNAADGAGHVAVVEVIDGDSVTTSESGWQSFYFKTVNRSRSHPNLSEASSYGFLGYIYVMGEPDGGGEAEKSTYEITYHANGGAGAPSGQTKLQDEALTLSSAKPSLRGHTFVGWNTEPSGTGTSYPAGGTYTENSAVTLYAQWKANTYHVILDAMGGSVGENGVKITYGAPFGPLPVPKRAGYVFRGWYTGATGGTKISDETLVSVTSDIVLYARWEGNVPHTESIFVKTEGGYQVETALYHITEPCEVIVAGYLDGQFVALGLGQSAEGAVTCTLEGELDQILVMVWRSLSNPIPLCEAERILIPESPKDQ